MSIGSHRGNVLQRLRMSLINCIRSLYSLISLSRSIKLECSVLRRCRRKKIDFIKFVISYQIDKLGMHKSYNVLEHAKFINNLREIKNILLFSKSNKSNVFDEVILKMTSILNEYFHLDGSLALFNGTNNIYTMNIYIERDRETHELE